MTQTVNYFLPFMKGAEKAFYKPKPFGVGSVRCLSTTAILLTITTSLPNTRVVTTARRTACWCIGGVIMRITSDMDSKQQGLEPCEGRLSCTVLRGLGPGNMPWLPGAFGRS